MIKFPSIGQFRNVVQNYRYDERNNNIMFRGTVKLHGTNSAIVWNRDKGFSYQSRQRVLTLAEDNCSFMKTAMTWESQLKYIIAKVFKISKLWESDVESVAIFGEWCGEGIQKGVAINRLPKMFVIFAIKVTTNDGSSFWFDIGDINFVEFVLDTVSIPDAFSYYPIYVITEFPTFEIEIDFKNLEDAQNRLAEITESVEKECPVAKEFGVSGIGEGVVWMPTSLPIGYDERYWFKVKGEKHSNTKVKSLPKVDAEEAKRIKQFVEAVTAEPRLVQGVWHLEHELQKPLEMESMGDFIRWVHGDILKEESDLIEELDIDKKKIGKYIANRCRDWFKEKVDSEIFERNNNG